MTYVHFCTNSDVFQLLKIHTAITYFYSTFAYKSAFTLFKNTMVLPITVVNQLYHAFIMILPWYINYTRMQTGYSVVSLRY